MQRGKGGNADGERDVAQAVAVADEHRREMSLARSRMPRRGETHELNEKPSEEKSMAAPMPMSLA